MNVDFILEVLNRKLIESQNPPLNTAEALILRGIWEYKTYNQVAEEAGYSPGYFTNVVAPELFRRLSEITNERVTKKNCRVLLESYVAAWGTLGKTLPNQYPVNFSASKLQDMSPCFPSGAVSLDSPFYIERSPIEEQVYAEISKPGALVRIKAPQEMGKTSLLLRVLDYANRLGYYTVNLNLQQVDQAILSDINKFLRWLCVNIARQLHKEARLDDYWDEDIGCKISCTLYLRNYLLEQIDSPLILALDEVNQIFEHPEVAKDFFPLLRSWYEEAKRIPVWQKLRLIVVHSTDIYVPLQLKQSPFNVGLPIQLNSFSLGEVINLAKHYGLNWTGEEEVKLLMDMVGGHPALVHIAIYHLSRGNLTIAQLLQSAPTSTGIYSSHLQRHQATLKEQQELASALGTVMSANDPVPLDPILAYKLSSMGLIQLNDNKATLSCQLYQQYFQNFQAEHRSS
ncbi:AAA-like domain-containing protein [Phormidium sp. LEGE 05292]|uniref:AAA-like domain-containing protein n=1 Tax=[Phormidium] sp. LEGE 05292 TaxID=767427 RepID=UPI00187F21F4|nr:AAA-like domain-containing protein [Phormidium sp. LEGE 05292]MBE9224887.1 AAA-like domain-containing protein [Phormidium sp. LEGE 05292]